MSPTPAVPRTETEWLDRGQQQAWRSFMGGSTVLMDRLDRDLRHEHDLSMAEYEILVRLSESPERSLRMAELAAMVSHSRSRVTHTIARLERVGIVHRQPCKDDGRGVEAVLTDHGFSVLEKAAHTHVQGVRAYLVDRAAPEDLAAIGRVMERIVTELDGQRF
ncbi:MAG: MarR family transcriptional regulator [Nocardioidaceae bacterium]|nr:MarR family transcriptional regulator [Nocardioidaceae bacterium]